MGNAVRSSFIPVDEAPQTPIEVANRRVPVALYRFDRMIGGLLITLFLLVVIGCAKNKPPAPVPIGPDPAAYEALEADNRRLQETVRDQDRLLQEKEVRINRLQLQLLESDARYQSKVNQISSQQDMLDEAVVEVVRAKAKLRSIESRAEAASSITEAEIALKSLRENMAVADDEPSEDYLKAETLLRMSTNEYKKENYGGALYLAGQAQSQIRAIQSNISHQADNSLIPGEVLFAQPLPLKVLRRSNLRQGPSQRSKIKRTLDADTLIVGHSYKEDWIRVHTEDGGQGWVFQTLVGGR